MKDINKFWTLKMLPSERRELIYKWICEQKSLSLSELSRKLKISEMTIRRDLDLLDQEGMLKRVRGGAVAIDSAAVNFLFDRRSRQQVQQKSRIARFAAQNLVQDNDIILMEGGTTVHMMVSYLDQSNLTILTNGLKILTDLSNRQGDTVVMASGGTVDYSEQIFVGPQAASFFSDFRTHKCFVGADGLTLEDGATEALLSGNEIKRAMVDCAREVILLIDSAKIGTSSLVPAIEAEKINAVVTDKDASKDVLKGLAAKHVKVYTV